MAAAGAALAVVPPATAQPVLERIAFTTDATPNPDLFVFEDGPVQRAAAGDDVQVTQLTSSPERDSRAVWSPDGSMIAVERVDVNDGSTSVVIVPAAPGGSATPEPLTVVAGSCPTWAPGSDRFAVAADAAIVVHGLDGGLGRTLGAGACPRWSPSGDQIAATQDAGRIVAFDPETGSSSVIHEEATALVGEKEWSPDGTLLAYGVTPTDSEPAVVTIGADGGSRTVIAATQAGEHIGPIRWHPDGSRLAFNSETSLGGSLTKIYLAPVGGGGAEVVADTPDRGDRLGGWNPSGTYLVFESYSVHNLADPDLTSYVMVVEPGGAPSRIGEGSAPAFAPVGVAAPGPAQVPATGGDDDVGGSPIAVAVPVGLGVLALLAGGLFLMRRAGRAVGAHAADRPDRDRSGHAGCVDRAERALSGGGATEAAAGLGEAIATIRASLDELIVALEVARVAFEPVAPAPPEEVAPDDPEAAAVDAVLDRLADTVREGR